MAETTPAAPTPTPAPSASPSATPPAAPSAASPTPTPATASPSTGDSFVVSHEPAAAVAAPAQAAAAKPAKPDGIPDDLWDVDAGSYKPDAIKQLVDGDATERARRGALPKSAAEYKPDLPDDVKLPEGGKILVDDPRYKELQEIAYAEGLTQKAFSRALGVEVKAVLAREAATSAAVAARDEALGPNGPARVDALTGFFKVTSTTDKMARDMAKMLVTPENVAWFESAQAALGSQGIAALSRAPVAPAPDPKKVEGWDKMSTREQIAFSLQRGRQATAR